MLVELYLVLLFLFFRFILGIFEILFSIQVIVLSFQGIGNDSSNRQAVSCKEKPKRNKKRGEEKTKININ